MRRRTVSPFLTALALVLATAPAARTAPGDLDPTFGGDGVVRTDLTPDEDYGFAVTIQPDGKIVVAGEQGLGGPNPRFAIVRYETDGSLDPSFGGGDGRATIDFTPGYDVPYAVRIQANGKIVVAGTADYFGRQNSRFALARLTPAVRSIRCSGATGPSSPTSRPCPTWCTGWRCSPTAGSSSLGA